MTQNGQNMLLQNNTIKGKVLCMTKLDSYIYVEPQQDSEKYDYGTTFNLL
jgi:hypothetical protein